METSSGFLFEFYNTRIETSIIYLYWIVVSGAVLFSKLRNEIKFRVDLTKIGNFL